MTKYESKPKGWIKTGEVPMPDSRKVRKGHLIDNSLDQLFGKQKRGRPYNREYHERPSQKGAL